MKKLTLFFFSLLVLGLAFQACDNTKSYAEMLEDEKKAIKEFIKERDIKVISQSEFFQKDSITDTLKNEYVQLASGIYMQIVDKGSDNIADTVRNREDILVRFMEYSIFKKDTSLINLFELDPDKFGYTANSYSIAGAFEEGVMMQYYGSAVPAGWLVPLDYVREWGHVRLIVPSKMGHTTAMQSVYPYYYEIYNYQFYR